MNNTIETLSNKDFDIKYEMEKCIVCDIETPEPISKHIDYRSYYIEGAGQLCKECFFNINNKKYIPLS